MSLAASSNSMKSKLQKSIFLTVLMTLVLAQFTLGIFNVVFYLPLANAVAHNAGAALLLATLLGSLSKTSNRAF